MSLKIAVKVYPGSKKNQVEYLEGEKILKIWTTEQAQDGKANEAVVKIIAKNLNVPKSLITIRVGQSMRSKIIEVNAPVTEEDLIKNPRLFE